VSGANLLLVEDDAETRRAIIRGLRAHDHQVDEAADGAAALERWEARRPDLVLLDLGLPDTDGISLIRRIRREATTPILVLSARDRENDRVQALEVGADDYLTKPFGMRELHARIGALLRRAGGPTADAEGLVSIGPLVVDVARHEVRVHGADVPLTPREFELLKVLVAHAGRLVTTGRLLRSVWGASYDQQTHYVHVYVSQLRRKLAAADPAGALDGLIVTEPGVGYRVGMTANP
jgi:two-component system, OmpR family, KDP operon response regulator KdpE